MQKLKKYYKLLKYKIWFYYHYTISNYYIQYLILWLQEKSAKTYWWEQDYLTLFEHYFNSLTLNKRKPSIAAVFIYLFFLIVITFWLVYRYYLAQVGIFYFGYVFPEPSFSGLVNYGNIYDVPSYPWYVNPAKLDSINNELYKLY